MKQTVTVKLQSPRVEQGQPLLIAGLQEHYTSQTIKNVPALWQRLNQHFGKIPAQIGKTAYGVVSKMRGDGCDYLAGVPVSDLSNLPSGFSRVSIPASQYVVFPHREHVSLLNETMTAIWNDWLPSSGYEVPDQSSNMPDMLERYGESFNPQTGMGDIEVWAPVKTKVGR